MSEVQFYVQLSQVGLTEKLKGDKRKFELWSKGREEVVIIQAPTMEVKEVWVKEIKRVLMNQFDQIKSEWSVCTHIHTGLMPSIWRNWVSRERECRHLSTHLDMWLRTALLILNTMHFLIRLIFVHRSPQNIHAIVLWWVILHFSAFQWFLRI